MHNPTDMLSINLQAQEWNVVLAALMEAPYRISNPLIEKITGQARELASEASTTVVTPPSRSNGSGRLHEIIDELPRR
jgi:hypothetical protein